MSTLLPASLQNSLQEIVERSNQRAAGIRAVLLSTTEGVPLGRVIASTSASSSITPHSGDSSREPESFATALQEDGLASIESVWAPASKQFPVLGLDKLHQVTAIYDHGTLVHIYQAPMVSSFESEIVLSFDWFGITSVFHGALLSPCRVDKYFRWGMAYLVCLTVCSFSNRLLRRCRRLSPFYAVRNRIWEPSDRRQYRC